VWKTEIKSSKGLDAAAENLSAAIRAIKRGGVIVYPTETLYGLGADAFNDAAVEKVFQLKDRPPDSPIPVLVADQRMLRAVVADVSGVARKLMDQFWPGPLTLVLPARKNVPKPLLNPLGGIGVRISRQPTATQLVKALGRPLTATSANPSGQEPARSLHEAKKYFAGRIPIFIDGGTLASRRGSTVVEILAGGIRIIREGEIKAARLRQILGTQMTQGDPEKTG
jgi:L-threonylcarbamoyladenylate synthase